MLQSSSFWAHVIINRIEIKVILHQKTARVKQKLQGRDRHKNVKQQVKHSGNLQGIFGWTA